VNHRPALWGDRDPAPLYRRVAERSTIVFAGADEAELLVGSGSPEQLAARIADLGPAQAIVKLGEDGCVASIDGEALSAPAEKITPLDTVGAGDAFVAGYLVALLDGLAPADRLRQGARCGAFACLGPGDWESLPRRADLDAFGSGDPVIR
jgi:2-dehydro-3-deoxygluconokinase